MKQLWDLNTAVLKMQKTYGKTCKRSFKRKNCIVTSNNLIEILGENWRWILHFSVWIWVLKGERIRFIELSSQNLPQNPALQFKKIDEISTIHGRMRHTFFLIFMMHRALSSFQFLWRSMQRAIFRLQLTILPKALITIRGSIIVRPPQLCNNEC